MQLAKVIEAWEQLVGSPDLIGREATYFDRIGDNEVKGTISAIRVENGFVIIECPEIAEQYRLGTGWAENISFRLNEDRYPELIGKSIFCDIDERQQVVIAAT